MAGTDLDPVGTSPAYSSLLERLCSPTPWVGTAPPALPLSRLPWEMGAHLHPHPTLRPHKAKLGKQLSRLSGWRVGVLLQFAPPSALSL